MSGIKKLAGQTLWYGLPTIGSRFLGYILNFSLSFIYQAADTADLTQIYAIVPFVNILFTYGVETSYFRFSQQMDKDRLYNTLNVSILSSTILFSAILLLLSQSLATATLMPTHPEYFVWLTGIIFLDTLATLPFAKLRQEGRPRKYAFVRVAGIVVNVLVVVFFIGVCPQIANKNPDSLLLFCYDPSIGIGYYLIGNLVGSATTFLLLWKEWRSCRFSFDGKLWKEVMKYAYPLVIVGLGGMVNEMISRLVYQHVVNLPAAEAKRQLGIFAANYRLAVLITIFIQMFRMAAEPFFFNQAKEENAKKNVCKGNEIFCDCLLLHVFRNRPFFRCV